MQTQADGALVLKAPVPGGGGNADGKTGASDPGRATAAEYGAGDGRLEAELLVPSRPIGFVAPRATVLLRYQAFPYEKFGHQQGRLSRVSRSALGPSELGSLIGNPQQGEPY